MYFAEEYTKVNKQESLNACVVGYDNANQATSTEEEMAIASAVLIQQVTEAQKKTL